MVSVPVLCPYCQSTEVIKAGRQANGAQRYLCQNGQCARRIFLLQYQDRGRALEGRRQVVEMALNGSGIRDTARVLRISPTTVIAILKKKPPGFATSPPHSSTLFVLAPVPPASTRGAPPSWMKCGVLSAPERPHGGCGMRSIITRGECLRISSAPVRMQRF